METSDPDGAAFRAWTAIQGELHLLERQLSIELDNFVNGRGPEPRSLSVELSVLLQRSNVMLDLAIAALQRRVYRHW